MSKNKSIRIHIPNTLGELLISNHEIKSEHFNRVESIETDESDIIYYDEEIKTIFLMENIEYCISFKTNKKIKEENIFTNFPVDIINKERLIEKDALIKHVSFTYNNYVGKMSTQIKDKDNVVTLNFEIRTSKMDYETDYKKMINDLSTFSNSLIYNSNSPVTQSFKLIDGYTNDDFELYMYLEYLFKEENLPLNYKYITRNMYSVLNDINEIKPTVLASNIDYNNIDVTNLIKNTHNASLPKYMPYEVNEITQTDTIDNPENQFFKYFLELIQEKIDNMLITYTEGYLNERLIKFQKIIEGYVQNRKLREISKITSLPLNSQVLQKKEGYKKILQYFFELNNIYEVNWDELEQIINGNEKKIYDLYEKWCYFVLVKVLEDLAKQEVNYEDVFEIRQDENLGDIKTGFKQLIYFNDVNIDNNKLDIELGYNVTYQSRKESYSIELRPDYTIKIKYNNRVRYIHFDAKYKSDTIKTAENEENRGYDNQDIAKMHAYKDAIENTICAYILYPGTQEEIFTENKSSKYVGVGAIPLLPNNWDKDKIKNLIKEIIIEEIIQN